MEHIFPAVIFVLGLCMIVRELIRPTFGWICYPFAMIAFWMVMDVCVSPYMLASLDVSWPEYHIVERSSSGEYFSSAGVLIVWYASIGLGMGVIKYTCSGKASPYGNYVALSIERDPQGAGRRIFNGGLILTGTGILANVGVLLFFPRDVSVEDIMNLRLFYSAAREMEGPEALIFGYLRMFSYLYQLGIVMLIMNSGKSRKRRAISGILVFIGFILFLVYGGREAIILFAIVVLFAGYYAKPKIRFNRVAILGGMVLLTLVLLTSLRFGIGDLKESVGDLATALLTNRYLDDVSFVVKTFPDKLAHLHGQTLLDTVWGFFAPGISSEWIESLYKVLVDNFGNRLYYLTTGVHYSSAAEAYANFGLAGVPVFGLVAGGVFGLIFVRQANMPHDRLFTSYVVVCSIHLFSGLPTKMGQSVAATGFFSVVPIALFGAIAMGNKLSLIRLFLAFSSFLGFYILYRISGSLTIKMISAFSVSVMTVVAMWFLWRGPRWRHVVRIGPVRAGDRGKIDV